MYYSEYAGFQGCCNEPVLSVLAIQLFRVLFRREHSYEIR
jgi:hypothetical protein